jgi:hypothetical protein
LRQEKVAFEDASQVGCWCNGCWMMVVCILVLLMTMRKHKQLKRQMRSNTLHPAFPGAIPGMPTPNMDILIHAIFSNELCDLRTLYVQQIPVCEEVDASQTQED